MNRLVLSLATLGPIGRNLPAPGTMGSMAGVLVYAFLVFAMGISAEWVALCSLPLFILGIPLCSRAEILLGRNDPGEVIWDEFCVIPLVYLPLSPMWKQSISTETFIWLLAGFSLFRVFDITKPSVIRSIQKLPRGWGVMLDDLLAALLSALVLWGLRTFSLSFLN